MSVDVSVCQYMPAVSPTCGSDEEPDAYGHKGPVEAGQAGHEGAQRGGEQGGGC